MTLNDGILGTNSQLESSDITPIALQDSGQTSSQSNNSGDLSYNVKYDDLASGVQNIESILFKISLMKAHLWDLLLIIAMEHGIIYQN